MKNKIAPWLVFFRLPNLPTAPGDSIAGAAIALAIIQPPISMSLEQDVLVKLFAAGAAALLFYMFGLADNDIVGAEEDKTHAPKRPIPSGGITLAQAQIARATCLILAVVGSALCHMPVAWWCASAVLVLVIAGYNRIKSKWPVFGLVAMGLCRGLSLLTGAAAMQDVAPGTLFSPAVLLAVAGWTAYIGAVSWLASKEHEALDAMPGYRFLAGLTIFVPMAGLAFYPPHLWTIISVCSVCAYGVWWLSVLPLGRPHTPEIRRRSVGNAIGAILYLQAAYILAFPHVVLVSIVIAIFTCNVIIRKFFGSVQGS